MKHLIYFFIILNMCSSRLYSQSSETQIERKVPTLNGHMFPSVSYLRSSFIVTSLQADLGYGITSGLSLPGIMIDDHEILSFEGKILFADMDVQYHQRFTPWLSFFLSLRMAARIGNSMSTILVDGVNTISGSDIGWLVRIMKTDKFNLAGAIKLSNVTASLINVTDYFEEIINDEPYPSVIKKVPGMTAGLGLRGAYAFNPTYGLQFNADYTFGESFERGSSGRYFMGGFLGDLDFNPKHKVPIGLAMGYTISSSPAYVMDEGGISNLILGRIGYTGSDDFELGLQFTYYNAYLKSVEEKPFVKKVMLTLKFYF